MLCGQYRVPRLKNHPVHEVLDPTNAPEGSRSELTVRAFSIDEWLPAIKMAVDATTCDNWQAFVHAYVVPRLDAGDLHKLTAPMLVKFYTQLLTDGRIKPDNIRMHEY